MRAFWIIVGLLVLGAAAFAVMGPASRQSARPATPDAERPSSARDEIAIAPPVAPAADARTPASTPAPTPSAASSASMPVTPVTPVTPAGPEAAESLDVLRKQRADALLKVQALRDQAGQVELSIQRLPDRAESLEAKLVTIRDEIRLLEAQADDLAAKIGAAALRSIAAAEAAAAANPVAASSATSPAAGANPAVAAPAPGDAADAAMADAAPDAPAAGPANLDDFAAPARIAGFEVVPAKLAVRPQGGVLVDERFVVSGSGTQPDPFVVPWELLTSAEDTFAPQAGKKQIPQRIAMLDGKFVRVKGYVAFPLAMDQPRELLAMLNQWDGCCIGVPPTPYDAIEVQLRGPAQGDDRFAISGEVAGRFGVKPYVVGDWLVGLYVMETADFKARGAPGT